MTDVQTLQWVFLDQMPVRLVPPARQVDPEYDGVPMQEIDPEFYAGLPLPEPFKSEAARIVAAEEGDVKCDECGETIGWELIEDDDHPHSSGMRWNLVCVVDTGRAIALTCEDCSPAHYAEIGTPINA